MRIGWNPIKRMKRAGGPARITVVTVTHIPFLAGFYAQSLDVLRLMLASLRAHTSEDFDLLVFDNASCAETQDYLLDEFRRRLIQYLVLSQENLGILGAHNFVFSAAPGEYIAYADSDVFFHPGWLEKSLQVLETFPNVGLVTAVPVRHMDNSHTESTLRWAHSDPSVETEEGALLPEGWIADYCEGTGRDLRRYLDEWKDQADYRLTYHNARAYAGASSFQFVARKSVLQTALPLPDDQLLHGAGELLRRLDAEGHLMLATDGLYIHHLGNTLNAKWRAVAEELEVALASQPLSPHQGWLTRLAQNGLLRRVLLRLYDGLFRLLYRGAT